MRGIDMAGQRFGRLVVQSIAPYVRRPRWKCLCDCGNEIVVAGWDLRHGSTRSCGCLKRDVVGAANRTHGEAGANKTRLYGVWRGIINRCSDPNNKNFHQYGGRGIVVCDEWSGNYEPFRDWSLENGYAPSLTIDRKDNDGPYSPCNCQWATRLEQNRNKRSCRAVVRSDGQIFRTISAARESVGGAWDSKIVAVCRGRRIKAYGYGWQYL